jgi:multiple sugar transport system ATP-binding protein
MAEIEFDDVTKRYADGTEAVKHIDLGINDGEFVILVGPSGCGKSTALRMIAGLEEISEGELKIGGEVVNDLAPKDRDIAMVFQNYALYPHMTVRENMGFALKLRGEDKGKIDQRVTEAAQILDLTEHLDRKPANLSGGQRQRVAMGRAIVREPKAFLMDEPLSNLDAKLRVQMRANVSRLQQRLGVTTVYVTHDQVEAMTLGDRVAVMRLGILQQFDTPRELYENPRNLFVAGFIGSPAMNFFAGQLEGGKVKTPIGDLPLPDYLRRKVEQHGQGQRDVIVGIRPEDFEDAEMVPEGKQGYAFEAPIELVESMGSEIYAHFGFQGRAVRADALVELEQDAGGADAHLGDEGARAVARLDPTSQVRVGRTARLWVDCERLHLFDNQEGDSLTRPSDGSSSVAAAASGGSAAPAEPAASSGETAETAEPTEAS